jgi:inner membrane protein
MDSLTQVALGSAVGYAVLGSKVGRKAIVWGAILGTLPDLDVFLPYAGEVEAFTYHRGFSHSLLIHLLVSPFIAWLIMALHKNTKQYKTRWFLLVFLTLSTHAILDSLTVYGTQLLWPLTEYPFSSDSMFIIDPLYTLPLLFGLAVALMPKVNTNKAKNMNMLGIAISTAYISWSLGAKVYIDNTVHTAMAENGIEAKAYFSSPAPLTTLLWRIVIMDNNQYYEGYASVFDSVADVNFNAYPSETALLKNVENEWGIQRLQWFTKGFYSIRQTNNKLVLSDLRMGAQCSYAFNFVVAQKTHNEIEVGDYTLFAKRPDMSQFASVWDRIWNASVSLAPTMTSEECLKITD